MQLRALVDCNHMYRGQKGSKNPEKKSVKALRVTEGMCWGCHSPLPVAQDLVSAQSRTVRSYHSYIAAILDSIFIPVGSWSPGWVPSPHNVCFSLSPALPLASAPFAPDGTTWIDPGPGSLLHLSGMAIDGHGQRLNQDYKQQSSFLKIIITVGILQDCSCAYMLSGILESIF